MDETRRQIKELEQGVLESKQNLPNITKLLEFLQVRNELGSSKSTNLFLFKLSRTDDELVFHAIKSLQRIFVQFIDEGLIDQQGIAPPVKRKPLSDAQQKVKAWIAKRYNALILRLLALVNTSEEPGIQIPALEALMGLAKALSEEYATSANTAAVLLNDLFYFVVSRLIFSRHLNEHLLAAFQEKFLWQFDDVRFFMLKSIRQLLDEHRSQAAPGEDQSAHGLTSFPIVEEPVLLSNILKLLGDLRMPTDPSEIDGWFVGKPAKALKLEKRKQALEAKSKANGENSKKRKREEEPSYATHPNIHVASQLTELNRHRSVFSKCWLEVLKFNLPTDVYKKVLNELPGQVLPHMTSPQLLMDFLTASFSMPGTIGLLALSGMFVMITQYNLEYPDFFPKVYSMLEPTLLFSKHRAHYFKLLDLFLRSSHLPTYLVCAFVKKMARLALLAPPSACTVLIPLIYNILIQHTSAQVLLHRTIEAKPQAGLVLNLSVSDVVKQDPFNFQQADPSKCRAQESSLWEIQALLNHFSPSVATLARLFSGGELRRQPFDVSDFLDQSYQTMLESDLSHKSKNGLPLAFAKPTTLFESEFFSNWSFQRPAPK